MEEVFNPFTEIRRFREEMDRLFDSIYFPAYFGGQKALPESDTTHTGKHAISQPYTDIVDKGDEIVITADMPGVDKEHISLSIDDDAIEMRAEKSDQSDEEREGYVRKERTYTGYFRRIPLGASVDANKSEASFKNGVLEVKLPKLKGTEKKKTLQIT